MSKSANKWCGKPTCKIPVPHEHVHYPRQGHSIADTPPVEHPYRIDFLPSRQDIREGPENDIEKALRALPCQDDPSADRFQTKTPETLPMPAWVSILTTNFERLYSETELLKRETESGMEELSKLIKNQNTNYSRAECDLHRAIHNARGASFAKIVFGVITGGYLLVGSTIAIVGGVWWLVHVFGG